MAVVVGRKSEDRPRDARTILPDDADIALQRRDRERWRQKTGGSDGPRRHVPVEMIVHRQRHRLHIAGDAGEREARLRAITGEGIAPVIIDVVKLASGQIAVRRQGLHIARDLGVENTARLLRRRRVQQRPERQIASGEDRNIAVLHGEQQRIARPIRPPR